MAKTLLLCLISGVLGAGLVAVVSHPPKPEAVGIAQESYSGPYRGQSPNAPVAVPPPPGSAVPAEDELTAEERAGIAVYENVNRSVVNITTRGARTDRFLLFEIPSEGEGSGSVITQDGHILTNYHVIDEAREIQVTLFDGNSYSARLVGGDPASDVAVLKINAPANSLYPVTFGDSTRLRVGQRVFAIGNPFGLERTMSTGIIASLNRSIPSRRGHRTMKQIIQIDAAINPGNSGGPLLDSRGRMIGMNTAIASKTGESIGIGFAIPVNTIARIVPQLLKSGRVVRPEVGITQVYQTDRGLLIALIAPGGPAEQAGLRGPKLVTQRKRQGPLTYEYQTIDRTAADLIVAVDGQSIRTADDFLSLIEAKQPGSQVVISVIREGRRVDVPVRLGATE